MLLEINSLSKEFGGLIAVSDLNMKINNGELVGLIGPNGAGKTTVFNLLTGVYVPSQGKIFFAGREISGLKPYQVTRLGMARTFQNIRLFNDLTVVDNVKIALHQHAGYNTASAIFRLPGYYRGESEFNEKAHKLLKIFNLEDEALEIAKNLPYGKQRRLEIARALAAQPKLLLLDEPAAGMNPQETQDLMEMIHWIRDKFSLTILLIEHDMSLVMGVCERIYVLDYGMIIAEGTPDQIKSNPKVIEAYLGEEVSDAGSGKC
jgi:branched-chain amino acid transport system ATP-binding protein